jgi:trehalose 6-phosphate phosphatase
MGPVTRADRGRGARPRLELRAGLLHHRLRCTDLDAATLHIGLSGLLAPDDERFQATVTAIEAELRSGSTVYRYNRDDALPGGEGGFHLCASWLVEAYRGCGRRTEAEELFQQIVDAAGPTGLLPEEYDPITERSWATTRRRTRTSD